MPASDLLLNSTGPRSGPHSVNLILSFVMFALSLRISYQFNKVILVYLHISETRPCWKSLSPVVWSWQFPSPTKHFRWSSCWCCKVALNRVATCKQTRTSKCGVWFFPAPKVNFGMNECMVFMHFDIWLKRVILNQITWTSIGLQSCKDASFYPVVKFKWPQIWRVLSEPFPFSSEVSIIITYQADIKVPGLERKKFEDWIKHFCDKGSV